MSSVKLLVLTDLHMSGTRPAGRIGNFAEDVDLKLNEVIKIVHDENIAAVLCAGDVFHSPTPAFSAILRFLSFVERLDVPFITIAGSHDLVGVNLDVLSRTAIGFLSRVNQIELLSAVTKTVTKVGDVVIGIKPAAVTGIELVHECVLPTPTFGDYTLISDYQTSAKLVIVGHYHSGFTDVFSNGTLYIGPGSLVRMTAHTSEFTRRPRIGIITMNNTNPTVVWRELRSAKLGQDVLEQPVVVPKIDFSGLISVWTKTEFVYTDARLLLKLVAAEDNIPESTLTFITKFLEEVSNETKRPNK